MSKASTLVTPAMSVCIATPLGPVRGSIIDSYNGFPIYSFQGIPYAKPPVGDLRLKDPVPIEPWTTPLDATKPPTKSACYNTFDPNPSLAPGTGEDCLYLNVFAPKEPDTSSNLPVMVNIHGGGFTTGDGSRNSAGPDYLVPKGVVYVSINYRLGALGFLSFQNEECPGNFGLKDQNLALRWVQQNISAYGGNPNNVTIFGVSAGGASVHYHLLSPLSRGLFQKGILQSGSALNRWAYSYHPVECGLLLAKRLGCDTTDTSLALKTIREASVEDITEKSVGILNEIEGNWDGTFILSFPFVPTAEPKGTPNAFLTKTPKEAIADGDYLDVPTIQGACSAEMILGLKSNFVPTYKEDAEYQKMLPREKEITLDSKKTLEAAKMLKEFYFPKGNTQAGYIQALSDVWFTHGIYKSIKAQAEDPKKKSPDYLYVFDATTKNCALRKVFGNQDIPGCCHADDAEFLFHPIGLFDTSTSPIDPATPDGETKELVTSLWTDFAKTGVPSPDWKPLDPKIMNYVRIASTLQSKTGYLEEQMNFMDTLCDFLTA